MEENRKIGLSSSHNRCSPLRYGNPSFQLRKERVRQAPGLRIQGRKQKGRSPRLGKLALCWPGLRKDSCLLWWDLLRSAWETVSIFKNQVEYQGQRYVLCLMVVSQYSRPIYIAQNCDTVILQLCLCLSPPPHSWGDGWATWGRELRKYRESRL